MMRGPMPPAICVEDLTHRHGHRLAVHRLNCHFEPGSLTAVVGPNGAGKTSLLAAMAGHLRPASGVIRMPPDRSRVAYLPQQSRLDRSFPMRVHDLVMLGAWPRLKLFRGATPAQRGQAEQALQTVGLYGFENRLIEELSIGQFQRVLFARLLLQDASVILLDEPFAAIDGRTSADLMALVEHWHAERRTVIAVLHDLSQVRSHFPSTLLLARERIAHGPTASVLNGDNFRLARRMAERWEAQGPCPGIEPQYLPSPQAKAPA